MKKYLLSSLVLLCSSYSFSQSPEDVLRYSYFPQQGTARNLSVGGAMGSLGGDLNALFVNPAGLAMYKTKEWVISPGLMLNKNKVNYRGTNNMNDRNGFTLGTSGLVIGYNEGKSKWANQAFSIGFTQTASFNNTITYKGSNTNSSYSEVFAEQFSNSGLTIDQALNNGGFAYGTAPALYTYLVDTFRNANGDLVIKSLPEFLLDNGLALQQQKTIETRGGIYELALGYAANMDDKLYLGGSFGIPFVSHTKNTTYRESDPTNDTTNRFGFFEHTDRINTTGIGLNAKLGVIYKPKEYIRLGFAVHTPTFYYLTDKQTSSLTTNSENYTTQKIITANSNQFTNTSEGNTTYNASTPLKLMVSGSYVIREVKDTRKQRGFITADIEYIGYGSTRFRPDGENVTEADRIFYKDLKGVIKDYYKGTFNYRLGGELKFNTVMFRLGGAYYGNPYEDKQLKSNITQASGGIGYRDNGMFIDLTYVHSWITDVNFPYRLNDKANTYAEQKTERGSVMLTVGFKF